MPRLSRLLREDVQPQRRVGEAQSPMDGAMEWRWPHPWLLGVHFLACCCVAASLLLDHVVLQHSHASDAHVVEGGGKAGVSGGKTMETMDAVRLALFFVGPVFVMWSINLHMLLMAVLWFMALLGYVALPIKEAFVVGPHRTGSVASLLCVVGGGFMFLLSCGYGVVDAMHIKKEWARKKRK